jgi:hypothetical protein
MKINWFKKGLVVVIIVLFIGLASKPAVSKVEPREETFDQKNFLFQTIIDISNNPEVNNLFEENKNKDRIFNCDYNFENVYPKLIFRNPRLIFSLLFSKPSMTFEYLNLVYNQGCELITIIGEEEALDIIYSVEIRNPEFFNDLNTIILNDEELSNRISKLREMNRELKTDSPFQYDPTICAIIDIVFIPRLIVIGAIILMLSPIYDLFPLLYEFLLLNFELKMGIFLTLLINFECIDWPYLSNLKGDLNEKFSS